PDGMLIVPAERTAEFLAPLSVAVISGVGPKAQEALARIGVRTIGQLREIPRSTLAPALGPRAPEIAALADGRRRTGLGHRPRDRERRPGRRLRPHRARAPRPRPLARNRAHLG